MSSSYDIPSRDCVPHPIYFHFIGQAGTAAPNSVNGKKVFTSFNATIATSGMEGDNPYTTPILLTCDALTGRRLRPEHMYSMTCKMVGSNTATLDHLHFTTDSVIDLGLPVPRAKNPACKFLNKVLMTALGVVFERQVVQTHPVSSSSVILLTLKSVHNDPISGSPVVWKTEHHVASSLRGSYAVDACNVGVEVLIHGAVVDYDDVTNTWETKVDSIMVTGRVNNHVARDAGHSSAREHDARLVADRASSYSTLVTKQCEFISSLDPSGGDDWIGMDSNSPLAFNTTPPIFASASQPLSRRGFASVISTRRRRRAMDTQLSMVVLCDYVVN
ncbi:uncharacterized protein MELLADRAFT_70077 [Melampsora larici-populina 98AG31]|uniref:Uncharacterized protein n=1 Tax=Melampsora larici-populina (strain 98AG31 / pathotype 3-4-7) TaxID=747676 RepID=F4SDH4_MELLP|nr:uncharacterized protein MELLADRAFT_70077 [Melampsora larici-populina 98AG31]EGF97303.1 hypothetical protein MELLADRAFT_70077 [Melampsora larici-populina 98AG31]